MQRITAHLLSAAAALVLVGPSTAGTGTSAPRGEHLRVLLTDMAAEPLPPAELFDQLLALGPDDVAALLSELGKDDLARYRRPVHNALRAVPEAATEWIWRDDRSLEEWTAASRIGLLVGRELGRAGDLETALALATPPRADELPAKIVVATFEDNVGAVLARDELGFQRVGKSFRRAHESLQPALVRAAGDVGGVPALELLAQLLGSVPQLDAPILSQISRVAADVAPGTPTSAALSVRGYLRSPDPTLRRESAVALARLDDSESIPDLVAMLEDPVVGVRGNAHWALTRLTGIRRGPDPQPWERWLAAEVDWWERTAPETLGRLERLGLLDEAELVGLMNELAGHRLFRDELAEPLLQALEHHDPRIVTLACHALRQFRAPATAAPLIELLDHRHEDVRAEAWRALKAITGKDLPLDRGLWTSAIS